MASVAKELMIEEIRNSMNKADNMIVAGYSGIPVNDMTELRKGLKQAGGAMMVIKNRLARIVMREDGWKPLLDYIQGPTALVVIEGEFLPVVKFLNKFADEHEGFKIRGAILESMVVDESGFADVAKLPGRDVLVGKIVQGLAAPVTKFMRAISGPMSSFVSGLEEIKNRMGRESDAEEER